VFTGGIGERAAPVREKICTGLEHIGVRIDPVRNQACAELIHADGSACEVRVVPTNEEIVIARHAHRLLFANG
jgi:acetate kinase